ncbi:MAG: RagB/SusD family nutrient uptake outer membrane protein [Bacteroidales bacterium]|nr:RagB/SusD family nutrient uptake outer membrane protein [Bacteroidales bacterium]
MKTIKYLTIIAITLVAISCTDNFLDTKNLYQKTDESYYKTPEDIEEALAGAYAAVPLDAGNNNPFIVSELMSDDCFGGGGSNDDGFHSTDAYTLVNANYYNELFQFNWNGILRVNMILKRFGNAEYTNEDEANQSKGEALFLRAYFYFRLSQFFGPVPLKLEPAPANLPRATAEEMYGQIASDLKTAIEIMPATPYRSIPVARLGHITKWAAEAMMARVFLFYTGFYQKESLPLAGGGSVTKADVIGWIDDCVQNSGHDLLSDFRNNWAYSSVQRYPYTANNGLSWAGEEGDNVETVWAIKYSPYGGWNPPSQQLSYSNQHSLYVGLRQQFYLPFGQGWGGGPVNPQLWDSFEEGDIRREGSILNVNILGNPDEGTIPENFIWGSDNQMHETGLWQKKYMPIYDSINGALRSIYLADYPSQTDMQLWNMQDDVLLRFADVLLMGAELGGTNAQAYFDRVRARVGLASKPATLENIKLERRHELAFEGLRHFDLMRWHDMEAAHALVKNIPVKNVNVDEIYNDTYRTETQGFLPIPKTEITLSEGVLKQTPGWEEYQ